MTVGQKVDCLFCLGASGFELKLDKNGRPFFICSCCGVRVFMRGEPSLVGPTRLWGPIISVMRANEPDAPAVVAALAKQGAVA